MLVVKEDRASNGRVTGACSLLGNVQGQGSKPGGMQSSAAPDSVKFLSLPAGSLSNIRALSLVFLGHLAGRVLGPDIYIPALCRHMLDPEIPERTPAVRYQLPRSAVVRTFQVPGAVNWSAILILCKCSMVLTVVKATAANTILLCTAQHARHQTP